MPRGKGIYCDWIIYFGMGLTKKPPPHAEVFNHFANEIDFALPKGFLNFFKDSNGGDITDNDHYALIWPLSDLLDLNEGYKVDEFAPDFFLFGPDGGGKAYAIERSSGHIYEMPFIGMATNSATFLCNDFDEFLRGFGYEYPV